MKPQLRKVFLPCQLLKPIIYLWNDHKWVHSTDVITTGRGGLKYPKKTYLSDILSTINPTQNWLESELRKKPMFIVVVCILLRVYNYWQNTFSVHAPLFYLLKLHTTCFNLRGSSSGVTNTWHLYCIIRTLTHFACLKLLTVHICTSSTMMFCC
jgi:hypothetical protein